MTSNFEQPEALRASDVERGYNGWKNYPTWCVNLWLSNDEGLYNETRKRAQQAKTEGRHFSYELKDWVTDELAPDLGASFAADLLGYALGEVDWYEIADAWLPELAEA